MRTLVDRHQLEQEIKKSRFLASASTVASRQEALAFLDAVRQPAATHNCWAFKVGQDYRFSDDGEPGGTAGQPILRAIEGQGLDHVVVVVARYFGGIKLGAGGLVRAYGGVASECLRRAPQREVRPEVQVQLEAPFDCLGAVHALLGPHGALKFGELYGESGVVLRLVLDADRCADFERAVRDATRGRASVVRA